MHKHVIQWGETTILDKVRETKEFTLKEALHIIMTPSHQHLNQDERLELLHCWTMRQMEGRSSPTSDPTLQDVCILTAWCTALSNAIFAPSFTLALKMTRAETSAQIVSL